ncbi:hypothetical protein FRB98_003435 [Tulasnella sp. 332]|nr:hypothetical protein FRB98_003435 [Tulasnella sp. 332]
MYGGDAMDTKATVDPYADPPAAVEVAGEARLPTNPANGTHNGDAKAVDRERERSRSRSRSPVGRSYRSPRRDSPPPAYHRRRSPPPPRRPPHAPQAPTPTQVLGVFGLSIRTVERQLDEEFGRYGTVDKVTIVYDARTGRSRGFGFIKMSAVDEATACIEKLNGITILLPNDLTNRRLGNIWAPAVSLIVTLDPVDDTTRGTEIVATVVTLIIAAADVIETVTLTDGIPTATGTGGTPIVTVTVIVIVIGATRGLRARVHQDVVEAIRGVHHHVLPDHPSKTILLCVALKVTEALLDGKVED